MLLAVLAILPSIIIGILIYKADKVEQEPKKEIIKALLMGILSVVFTLLLSWILGVFKIDTESLDSLGMITYSFIGIAFIEELSKWFCTKLFIMHNRNYNYLFDGIVYAVFVSLGFATIENILYIVTGGMITAVVRGIITVPSHAFYAVFMGYYLSQAKEAKMKKNKKNHYKYLIYSILFPVLLHGTFDALLLLQKPLLLLIFLFFVIFLYVVSIKKVKQLEKEEHLFEEKTKLYCKACGNKLTGIYCSNCGHKVEEEA